MATASVWLGRPFSRAKEESRCHTSARRCASASRTVRVVTPSAWKLSPTAYGRVVRMQKSTTSGCCWIVSRSARRAQTSCCAAPTCTPGPARSVPRCASGALKTASGSEMTKRCGAAPKPVAAAPSPAAGWLGSTLRRRPPEAPVHDSTCG